MVVTTRSKTRQRQIQREIQLNVDQQLQSPLYDGTIPQDIRELIFDYALREYVDADSYYPTNTDYSRPNFLGKKQIAINLLLTCKRLYLENRHLPIIKKVHTIWCGSAAAPPGSEYFGYSLGLTQAQLAHVKDLHVFTRQFSLENNFLDVCRRDIWKGLEKMKITLTRGDWRDSRYNAPLAITPHNFYSTLHSMKEDWRRQEAGEAILWELNCWGSAFRYLNRLKELEIEFETYEYKVKELDNIVEHAVLWKFPMAQGKVLISVDGLAGVKSSNWRGPPCAWTFCPECAGQNPNCKFCEKIIGLKMEGKGPMLVVRSITWKLADKN